MKAMKSEDKLFRRLKLRLSNSIKNGTWKDVKDAKQKLDLLELANQNNYDINSISQELDMSVVDVKQKVKALIKMVNEIKK